MFLHVDNKDCDQTDLCHHCANMSEGTVSYVGAHIYFLLFCVKYLQCLSDTPAPFFSGAMFRVNTVHVLRINQKSFLL